MSLARIYNSQFATISIYIIMQGNPNPMMSTHCAVTNYSLAVSYFLCQCSTITINSLFYIINWWVNMCHSFFHSSKPDVTDGYPLYRPFNSLRPRQNGRYFTDDTFKRIFWNENVWISIKISLKFVSKGPINNIPVLVKIMAWRRPGDKPLVIEPMMVRLPTHICVSRSQWVK